MARETSGTGPARLCNVILPAVPLAARWRGIGFRSILPREGIEIASEWRERKRRKGVDVRPRLCVCVRAHVAPTKTPFLPLIVSSGAPRTAVATRE